MTFPSRAVLQRWFLIVSTFVVVLGLSRDAFAQQVTISNAASIRRLDKDGKEAKKRGLNLNPEGINLQDCVDDQQLNLLGTMTFEQLSTTEVWAGVGQDCTAQTARNGGTAVCWKLTDGAVPNAQQVDVKIPVRRLMSGAYPVGAQTPDPSINVCGKIDLTTITIQFIYFQPNLGAGTNGTKAGEVSVKVDTVGPDPPSGLKALPGNTRIKVEWTNISGGSDDGGTGTTGGATSLTGVKVYCDPAQATTTTKQNPPVCKTEALDGGVDEAGKAIDAGTVDAGCEDGGTTSEESSGCSSPNFANPDGGVIFPTADFDKSYLCGEFVGNTGSSATASSVGGQPLANGKEYAVAVAATDQFGNVGKLSNPVCKTPDVTTDFWQDYRNAGGNAGDGCSTTGGDGFVGTAAIGLGAVVALSLLRRAKRGRRLTTRTREGGSR